MMIRKYVTIDYMLKVAFRISVTAGNRGLAVSFFYVVQRFTILNKQISSTEKKD